MVYNPYVAPRTGVFPFLPPGYTEKISENSTTHDDGDAAERGASNAQILSSRSDRDAAGRGSYAEKLSASNAEKLSASNAEKLSSSETNTGDGDTVKAQAQAPCMTTANAHVQCSCPPEAPPCPPISQAINRNIGGGPCAPSTPRHGSTIGTQGSNVGTQASNASRGCSARPCRGNGTQGHETPGNKGAKSVPIICQKQWSNCKCVSVDKTNANAGAWDATPKGTAATIPILPTPSVRSDNMSNDGGDKIDDKDEDDDDGDDDRLRAAEKDAEKDQVEGGDENDEDKDEDDEIED